MSGNSVAIGAGYGTSGRILIVDDDEALVVDVELGAGTTGFDLARFARRVIPGLLVIYMSGATSNASLDAFGVPAAQFLQKPFTPHELLGRLG